MFIWNPLKLKELKQRGLKLKYYNYDIRMRDKTIEELESEQAHRRVGGPEDHKLTSSDQASEEDSSNKR